MNNEVKRIHTPLDDEVIKSLKPGDMVLLSGKIYCGRDAVLPKVCKLIKEDVYKRQINDRAVNKMKNGVILINTARGGLIDEAALINGIKNGKIAGAGIDVYEKEPVDNSEVLNLQNVITTPHIGGVTYDSFYQMMYQAMRNIEMFDKGQLQEIEQSRYKF